MNETPSSQERNSQNAMLVMQYEIKFSSCSSYLSYPLQSYVLFVDQRAHENVSLRNTSSSQ